MIATTGPNTSICAISDEGSTLVRTVGSPCSSPACRCAYHRPRVRRPSVTALLDHPHDPVHRHGVAQLTVLLRTAGHFTRGVADIGRAGRLQGTGREGNADAPMEAGIIYGLRRQLLEPPDVVGDHAELTTDLIFGRSATGSERRRLGLICRGELVVRCLWAMTEGRLQARQRLVHQLPDQPQRMIPRDPRLDVHVGEQAPRPRVRSPHDLSATNASSARNCNVHPPLSRSFSAAG